MADHPLNSMHLEWPRREVFRRARAHLFNSCGEQTRLGGVLERSDPQPIGVSNTLVQNLEDRLPEGLDFGLMDKESIYPLKVGVNTIGRLRDNDVVIEDPHVSRRHCAIVIHASNGIELHDGASKNGTFLNGARLSGPTPLSAGDEIRMCDSQLIFGTKPGAQPAADHPQTLSE